MNEELKTLLKEYLPDDEALKFAVAFLIYCNSVDDIIDCSKVDAEFVVRTFELSADLYATAFYRRNWPILLPLIKATGNSYLDSVNFERSSEAWKHNYADVLRQYGNEVLCACVELSTGSIDKRREFSLKLREISYKTHHDVNGKAI